MRTEKTEKWEVIHKTPGTLQAEVLRGLLEAQGVNVRLAQEGAAKAIGIGIAPMGEVLIMTPTSQVRAAEAVINDYYEGVYENSVRDADAESPTSPED
ncbi:MAG: hypothetical protein ACE5GO_10730 [Anaerolineales bacterium]